MQTPIIHDKIYDIRGQKVMLDFDLAALYGVETRVSQIVTASEGKKTTSEDADNQPSGRMSQIVISSGKFRKKVALPYAFTEHGVSMLASVLRSEKAVQMSIAIVRAFIALKQYAVRQEGLAQQVREILGRLDDHDVQLDGIYGAIENLLEKKLIQEEEEQ